MAQNGLSVGCFGSFSIAFITLKAQTLGLGMRFSAVLAEYSIGEGYQNDTHALPKKSLLRFFRGGISTQGKDIRMEKFFLNTAQ